ncbi:MAG TPA: riboflavin synthase [Candidatus Limnocylindrales bacterium]|nr:riboflavin synthase [Candidatus Limnocylindrales bacterium]
MFSGIVGSIGTAERLSKGPDGFRLTIGHSFREPPEPGASVAVNGVCLTVERSTGGRFDATAVAETLAATTLGGLAAGDHVNLERALKVGDELGGHWVQGHVDGVGRVVRVERSGADVRVAIEAPEPLFRFLAVKGSVAVDGVSLTIASATLPTFTVALVPYTLAHTIASGYGPETRVNLEADLIARYLDRLADGRSGERDADAGLPGTPARSR